MNFDFDSVADFETHIKCSIPAYENMIHQVRGYVECFAEHNTVVVDLGCSTCSMLSGVHRFDDIDYVGIDCSNLIDECKQTDIKLVKHDIFDKEVLDYLKKGSCSVISSIFFLQFVQRSKRKRVLEMVERALMSGGFFIICEKVHFDSPMLENITFNMHQFSKLKNFNASDIMEKQQKLIRSMWLPTETEIVKELGSIGKPTLFWKSYGFTGYVVQKR